MQVTETNAEGLKREFKVVINAAEIEEKIDARLQELGKDVRVPGFRPGKIPTRILKQRFGPSVLGEVLERSVNDSSQQAIAERGLRPALQPEIKITSFEEGKDLEYDLAVELMPEVQPADFSTFELERVKVAVPQQEIDEALERLAQQQRKTEPLAKARKSKSGDVLVIDFKGTVDGEAFPGMEGEDHHLELGSNSFVAGFEDQLIGLDKDGQATVTVTFPEDYVNDKLAAQEAVFEVTVKDILATVPIAIDDEMAKAYGAESLEQLKERISEQLGGEYSRVAHSLVKRDILDKLAETHSFDVPAGMVEIEFDTIWKQVEEDRKAGRVDPDDEGKDEEALKSDYREIAERRVRLGLLLSEIGRLNNIEVSNEELQGALFQEAQRHPGHEREVIEFYQKNPQALANLRGPLYENKVIDFILEQAKVTEKSLSPEELRKQLEGESGDDDAEDAPVKPKAKAASKSGAKKAPASKAKAPAKKKAKKDSDEA
jgi:trigger factor